MWRQWCGPESANRNYRGAAYGTKKRQERDPQYQRRNDDRREKQAVDEAVRELVANRDGRRDGDARRQIAAAEESF